LRISREFSGKTKYGEHPIRNLVPVFCFSPACFLAGSPVVGTQDRITVASKHENYAAAILEADPFYGTSKPCSTAQNQLNLLFVLQHRATGVTICGRSSGSPNWL
jgi:hypothetical protein